MRAGRGGDEAGRGEGARGVWEAGVAWCRGLTCVWNSGPHMALPFFPSPFSKALRSLPNHARNSSIWRLLVGAHSCCQYGLVVAS